MDSPIKSYSSNNSLSTNQLLDREFSKNGLGFEIVKYDEKDFLETWNIIWSAGGPHR